MVNINKYENFFESISNDMFQEIKKYNNEWKEKFPELKMLKLEPSVINGDLSWLYSLEKKHDIINIDLFLHVSNFDNRWSIDFELIMESEDEYLNNNTSDKSMIQDEKHYAKSNLSYDDFMISLNKICSYIREWNHNFYKKWDFYPLVD